MFHLPPLIQDAYTRLGPCLTRDDAPAGYPIARLLRSALTPNTTAAQPMVHGWAAMLDPDRCPPSWLPWLAQAVGTTIEPGTPEDLARAMIKTPPTWTSGTPAALTLAVAATLTGSRRVDLIEHHKGNPWAVHVITYQGETPDPAKTLAAAKNTAEAGLVITHEAKNGWTWRDLANSGLTWRDVAKLTCTQLANIVPGTTAEEIKERYP